MPSLLLLLAWGCAKPIYGGQPQVMTAAEDANPDVIWVLRSFQTERDGVGMVELWGLFACYRSVEPGPPECHLAQTSGTKEALVWPDRPDKYDLAD
jgi:hypothetical protein